MALAAVSSERIMLSLGEWAVTDDPDQSLICLGLGSCVAFCAYDPQERIGGMAHMVLPDSNRGKRGGAEAKFVDLAIPLVLSELEGLGAVRNRLKIQLVGGAQMLSGTSFTDTMLIGQRNVESAQEAVTGLGLRLVDDDTGGDHGRTVKLVIATGELEITSPRRQLAAAA